jgi:hypothetical protein
MGGVLTVVGRGRRDEVLSKQFHKTSNLAKLTNEVCTSCESSPHSNDSITKDCRYVFSL